MRRGHMSSIKKRYHPRSTRSTKKSTRVKIAASHQRTQKLRWNQRTNPSKLNACCFFARQMTWYFAASRRYHRFSSRAPRFVAGGRAFTGFLLIGDYLQNPWGNFWNTYPHDCNIWLMQLWFVRQFQNNSWTQGFWTISTSSNWKQHVPTWITS